MYGLVVLTSCLLIASSAKVLVSDGDPNGSKKPEDPGPSRKLRDLVACTPSQPQDFSLCRLSLFRVSAGAGHAPQVELARITFYNDENAAAASDRGGGQPAPDPGSAPSPSSSSSSSSPGPDASERQASREKEEEEDQGGVGTPAPRGRPGKFFRRWEAERGSSGLLHGAGPRAPPVVTTARHLLPAQTEVELDVVWPSVRLVVVKGEGGPLASCWAAGLYACEYVRLTHYHAGDLGVSGGGSSSSSSRQCRRADDDRSIVKSSSDARLRRVFQVVRVHAEPKEIIMKVQDDLDDAQQRSLTCTTYTSRGSVDWWWEEQTPDGKLSPLPGHASVRHSLPNSTCWVHVSTLKVGTQADPRNVICHVGAGNVSLAASAGRLLGLNKTWIISASERESYTTVYVMMGAITLIVLLALICFIVQYKRMGLPAFAFLNRWLECGTMAKDQLSDKAESVKDQEEQAEEDLQDQKPLSGEPRETVGDGDREGDGDRGGGRGDEGDPVSPGTKRLILAARRDTLCQKRDSFVRLEHVIQEITEQTELATARLLSKGPGQGPGQDPDPAGGSKEEVVSAKSRPPPVPPKVRLTKSCLSRYENVVRLFEDRARSEAALREREVLQKGLGRSSRPKATGKDAVQSEDDQSDKDGTLDSANEGEAARERGLSCATGPSGAVEKGSASQIDFSESGTDTVRSKNQRRSTQSQRDSSQPPARSRSFSKPSEPVSLTLERFTNATHPACARTRSTSRIRSTCRRRSLSKTRTSNNMTGSLSAVDARSLGNPPPPRQTRSMSRTCIVGRDLQAASRDHSPLGDTTATRASSQSRHSSPLACGSLNPSRSSSTLPFTPTSSGQGFHSELTIPRMHQSRPSQKGAHMTRPRTVKFKMPSAVSSLGTLDKMAGRPTRHLSPSARVSSSSALEKKRRMTSPAKPDRNRCPARSEILPPSKKDLVRVVGFGSGYFVSPERPKGRATTCKGEGHGQGEGEGSSPNDRLSLLHALPFLDNPPIRSSRRHSGDSNNQAERNHSGENVTLSNGRSKSPRRADVSLREGVSTHTGVERGPSRERTTPTQERKAFPSPKTRDRLQGIGARQAPGRDQARTRSLHNQLSAGAHLSGAQSTKSCQNHPGLAQSFGPLGSGSLESSYSSEEVAFHFDSSQTLLTSSQDVYGDPQDGWCGDGAVPKATPKYISATLSPDSSTYFSRYDSSFGLSASCPAPDSVSTLPWRNASEAGPEKVRLGVSSLRGTAQPMSRSESRSGSPVPPRGNSPTPITPSPGGREACPIPAIASPTSRMKSPFTAIASPRPRENSPVPAITSSRSRENSAVPVIGRMMSPTPGIVSPIPRKTSPIRAVVSPILRETSPIHAVSPRPRETSPIPAMTSPRPRETSPLPSLTSPRSRRYSPVRRDTSPRPRGLRPIQRTSLIPKTVRSVPSATASTYRTLSRSPSRGGCLAGSSGSDQAGLGGLQGGTAADLSSPMSWGDQEQQTFEMLERGFFGAMTIATDVSSSSSTLNEAQEQKFFEELEREIGLGLSPPGLSEWSAEKRGVDLAPSSPLRQCHTSPLLASPSSLDRSPSDQLGARGDPQDSEADSEQHEAYLRSRIGSSAIGVWASPLMLQHFSDYRHLDSASFLSDLK